MTLLKDLSQLNESVTPSKFYVVELDDGGNGDLISITEKLFQLFGYNYIGTADELLDDEHKESLEGANIPVLTDLKVYAKRGLSSSLFDRDDGLREELWKDIDAHDYLSV